MKAENTTIDYGKGRVLELEPTRNALIITLSKELISHVKIVFEDSGIPGVIGPNVCMDVQDIVDRCITEDYKCANCVYNKSGRCSMCGGFIKPGVFVKRCTYKKNIKGKGEKTR